MKAVIMAGGEGTRLRPLTCDSPKPMAHLCGRPVLEYILDLLQEHDVLDAAVTMRYIPSAITAHFGDGYRQMRLSFSEEDKPLGTAGSVRLAVDSQWGGANDDVLIISGDALTDIDLSEACAFHKSRHAAATLIVTRVADPREYGLAEFDREGRITGFLEKPGWGQAATDAANTGIYILSPEALESIPADTNFDFAKDLFPLLLRDGQASYRQIAVDGVVPFRELEAYKFVYDSDWRAEYLGAGEGSPYLLYLEAGKPHTLTMTVKMGEYAPIVQELKRSAEELSALLLKITMITGPNPDPNYEYDLEKQIPDLLLDLTNIEKRLSNNVDQLFAISGRNTPAVSSLKQAAAQLRSVIAKPDTIARRIDALNTCQTNIVTWYTSIMQQPLLLDYILLSPPDEPAPDVRSSGWQQFLATCRSFGISFIKDYDSIGGAMEGAAEQTAIKVFTTLSNERGEVMKMLADETFTKRTGIQVNLKIVPAGQVNAGQVNALMLSLVSGRAPDVAIGVEPASAAEFAFRDAALDISGMEGFDALRKNFISAGFDGMTFQNKVYGIPETMDFKVLLVRTDLAEKIGFGVPDTWEELYDSVLPVLNQNKLNFYMPHAAQDYGIFLYQNGGRYYTEDGLRSALDTKEAYAGFKELSELFTSYGLPYSASFFNRFRSGEMPMGVATFGDYMQVAVAAPELAGKWAIAPLPGHRQADGTVDRSYTASIKTAGMLFSGSAHAAEGWEFLKWWMSTETQTEFGTRIESYLGPSAKWNTANIRAYPNLPWNQADLQVLASMWPYAVEVPPVLGGYFTDRHFNNAWNRVVVAADATVTMRDSLEQAVEDINKELDKKQREYAHLLKSPEE